MKGEGRKESGGKEHRSLVTLVEVKVYILHSAGSSHFSFVTHPQVEVLGS